MRNRLRFEYGDDPGIATETVSRTKPSSSGQNTRILFSIDAKADDGGVALDFRRNFLLRRAERAKRSGDVKNESETSELSIVIRASTAGWRGRQRSAARPRKNRNYTGATEDVGRSLVAARLSPHRRSVEESRQRGLATGAESIGNAPIAADRLEAESPLPLPPPSSRGSRSTKRGSRRGRDEGRATRRPARRAQCRFRRHGDGVRPSGNN